MTTSRFRHLLGAAAAATSALAVVVSASSASARPATTPPAGSAAPVTVAVADSPLGQILVDQNGLTLYLFTPDRLATSTCTGDCLTAWPVLAGPAAAGTGITNEDLGAITRPDDSSLQATFYGWPLYYFAGDKAPGDLNGQGKGGKWFLVDGEGSLVMATTPPATPPSAAPESGEATTPAGGQAPTPPSGPAPVSTVMLIDTPYGKVVGDGDGRALYAFVPDMPATSVCLDECIANWPAFEGTPTAGTGVDAALFGSVVRSDDGKAQVTYRGWPLYYFDGDGKAGDILGQGLGGKWYVLAPNGEAIRTAAPAS